MYRLYCIGLYTRVRSYQDWLQQTAADGACDRAVRSTDYTLNKKKKKARRKRKKIKKQKKTRRKQRKNKKRRYKTRITGRDRTGRGKWRVP